jgi:SagB-type dehydrogenase family enzyme
VRPRHAPLTRAELYGEDEPGPDDPAELFHEASKLYPALAAHQSAGMARLAASAELQAASLRATRRNPQRRSVPLPSPGETRHPLWTVLAARRSRRDFTGGPIALAGLAAVLDAAYGTHGRRRTVPSGGALYPLELYVGAHTVIGLEPGTYRYDSELHALEEHAAVDPWPRLLAACPVEGLVDGGAAALLLRAVFGRTRFKYGQRGYRFVLLEAGHVGQNALLAAAALDLRALPLGGYFDAEVDAVVGADGVEESVVYAVVLGA